MAYRWHASMGGWAAEGRAPLSSLRGLGTMERCGVMVKLQFRWRRQISSSDGEEIIGHEVIFGEIVPGLNH